MKGECGVGEANTRAVEWGWLGKDRVDLVLFFNIRETVKEVQTCLFGS